MAFPKGGRVGALERLIDFVHEVVIGDKDHRFLTGQIQEPIHNLSSFPEDLAKQQLGDVFNYHGLSHDPGKFQLLSDPPKLSYIEQNRTADTALSSPDTHAWYLVKMRGPESQVKPLMDRAQQAGGDISPDVYDQMDVLYPSKSEHFRGGPV
jgi:hypothetical protein